MLSLKRFIKRHNRLFLVLKQALVYLRYVKGIFSKSQYSNIIRIKPKDCFNIAEPGFHCWFGYYDKSPVSPDGTLILFNRVKDGNSFIDTAEICLYNIETRETKVISKTNTWNWQQGCMAQWIGNDIIAHNSYDSDKGYVTYFTNIRTGKKTYTERSAYSFNKSHSKYLSLNFYRLDLYAKGYGYPYPQDALDYRRDGIWEIEISSNSNKLILTLQEVIDYNSHFDKDCVHYINHVTYCPDEKLILFIHRWQKQGGEFNSRLLLFNKDNREIKTLLDYGHASHYCWKSEDELLIYATDKNLYKGYITLNIKTAETKIKNGLPDEDGHPSYSNDQRYILTDTYPNNSRKQYLFIYNNEKQILAQLDVLYSPFKFFNEYRCDLHPRWSFDNKYICVDTTYTGYRSLKTYEL